MCRNRFLFWFRSALIFIAVTGSFWLTRSCLGGELCTACVFKWCGMKETAVTQNIRGQPVYATFGSEKEGSKEPENTLLHSSDKALRCWPQLGYPAPLVQSLYIPRMTFHQIITQTAYINQFTFGFPATGIVCEGTIVRINTKDPVCSRGCRRYLSLLPPPVSPRSKYLEKLWRKKQRPLLFGRRLAWTVSAVCPTAVWSPI